MPLNVPPIVDERDGLLQYLAQQRASLKSTVFGLTEEQARMKAVPTSDLTVGGLIKHSALCERGWVAGLVANQLTPEQEAQRNWHTEFTLQEDETLESALALFDEVARETEAIIAGIPDLGRPVPVPQDVPWFPKDVKEWSVRWVLLHVIEEQARHGGHADLLREAIDGRTYYDLLAASQGITMDF
jgi:uncharacterized damage-inducible protein DinB